MKKTIPAIFLFLAVACATEPLQRDPDRLVVEGWIDSGAAPVVMVTSPVAATEVTQSVDDLDGNVYTKAYVTVKDEDTGTEVVSIRTAGSMVATSRVSTSKGV